MRALVGHARGEEVVAELAVQAKAFFEDGVRVAWAAGAEKRGAEVELRGGQLPAGAQLLAHGDALPKGVEGVRVAALAQGHETLTGERVAHVHRVFAAVGQVHHLRSEAGQPLVDALGEGQGSGGLERCRSCARTSPGTTT